MSERKKQAYVNAIANMEIEGFTFTEEEKEIFRKVAAGEISDAEFWKLVEGKLTVMKKEHPEYFTEER